MLCDVLLPLIWITACQTDETLAAYADRGAVYRLTELHGAAPDGAVTISFPARKSLTARTPCRAYAGRITAPLPWFDVALTQTAHVSCIELPLEQRFREALDRAALAEIAGEVLVFRDENAADLLVLRRQP